MNDLIRLLKGTLDLIVFLMNVTVITIVLIPIFVFLILPAYIMDIITTNK